jgi:zinc transporter 1/2/3
MLHYTWMGALFSLTTPVGIGIGMAVQSGYNENSRANLAITGVFDSMSAGEAQDLLIQKVICSDSRTRMTPSFVWGLGVYLDHVFNM